MLTKKEMKGAERRYSLTGALQSFHISLKVLFNVLSPQCAIMLNGNSFSTLFRSIMVDECKN